MAERKINPKNYHSHYDNSFYWNSYKHPYDNFTGEVVEKGIEVALQNLTEKSYYGSLISAYPVLIDDEIPKALQDMVASTDSGLCSDKNNVYFNTQKFAENVNDVYQKSMEKNGDLGELDPYLIYSIETGLAHEYQHIFSQHLRIQESMGKLSETEQRCFDIACEIEANRGHMVKNAGALYTKAITDDDIPDVREAKYLPDIYKKILELCMNSSKNSQAKSVWDNIKNKGCHQHSEENSNNENSSNKNKDKKGSDTSSEGNSTTESSSGGGDRDDGTPTSQSQGLSLTKEQIQKRVQQLKNVQAKVHEQGGRAEQGQGQESESEKGSEHSYGLEDPVLKYDNSLPATSNLEENNKRWEEKRIKKELGKLKSIIRGTLAKNKEKTYARPSRRPLTGTGGQGRTESSSLIRKGVKNEKSYSPKVLIALDSSGSMNGTTVKKAAAVIENLYKDLGKPKAGSFICTHESWVSECVPLSQWKRAVDGYVASGGNDFEAVVRKANELGVDVVLNVGDGQDCCYRGENGIKDEFKNNNRKWYDVIITRKRDLNYYRSDKENDKNNGFDREEIILGEEFCKTVENM